MSRCKAGQHSPVFSFLCSSTLLLENVYLACTALSNPSGTSHAWLHLPCFHISCTEPLNLLGGIGHGFLPRSTEFSFLQLLPKAAAPCDTPPTHRAISVTQAWDVLISKRLSLLPVGQVMVVLPGTSARWMGSHYPNASSKLSKDISFTSCYGEDPDSKIAFSSWPPAPAAQSLL